MTPEKNIDYYFDMYGDFFFYIVGAILIFIWTVAMLGGFLFFLRDKFLDYGYDIPIRLSFKYTIISWFDNKIKGIPFCIINIFLVLIGIIELIQTSQLVVIKIGDVNLRFIFFLFFLIYCCFGLYFFNFRPTFKPFAFLYCSSLSVFMLCWLIFRLILVSFILWKGVLLNSFLIDLKIPWLDLHFTIGREWTDSSLIRIVEAFCQENGIPFSMEDPNLNNLVQQNRTPSALREALVQYKAQLDWEQLYWYEKIFPMVNEVYESSLNLYARFVRYSLKALSNLHDNLMVKQIWREKLDHSHVILR